MTEDNSEQLTLKEARKASEKFKERFEELKIRARKTGMDLEFDHERSYSVTSVHSRVVNFKTTGDTADGEYVVTLAKDQIVKVRNQEGTGSTRTEDELPPMPDRDDLANYKLLEFLEDKIEQREQREKRGSLSDDYDWEQTLEEIAPKAQDCGGEE